MVPHEELRLLTLLICQPLLKDLDTMLPRANLGSLSGLQ